MKTRKHYPSSMIILLITCLSLLPFVALYVSENRRQAQNVAPPQQAMLQHSGWHGASCPVCRQAIASRNKCPRVATMLGFTLLSHSPCHQNKK